MIIAGAKGLAKELLEIFSQQNRLERLHFFDNVSKDMPARLFGRFPVVRTFDEARNIFKETGDMSFCLGLGNPLLRRKLFDEFRELEGTLTSVISPNATIGQFGTVIGQGCCILPGAVITSSVTLGTGCLVNPNATISHDCVIGDFVEVSPGTNITGNCHIGDYTFVGSNCVILPKIRVGKNVIIGAGAVVTKDVPDNSVVAGVPAALRRSLDPLNF
jgi:sugar O-acyltransferase (sialic acid O-acetyltransferase NeuD family)